jgi:hypothetical protein
MKWQQKLAWLLIGQVVVVAGALVVHEFTKEVPSAARNT